MRTKKPSKSYLRNKLDKICGEIIRGKGKCQVCGSRRTLQTAHIFSRTYNNTRWDLDNLLCLCASCHFYAHKNPVDFVEWVKNHLGHDKYQMLREKHNIITKYTIDDLQIKLQVLEQLKDELENQSICEKC